MSSQIPSDPHLILVWSFYDAPKELQDLSPHGGDEDWLAVVPPFYGDGCIDWLESGTSFGCGDVSRHDHPEWKGYKVYIGAHA